MKKFFFLLAPAPTQGTLPDSQEELSLGNRDVINAFAAEASPLEMLGEATSSDQELKAFYDELLSIHSVDGELEASLYVLPTTGFATLAQAVYLSGRIAAPPLCSGMSLCGRCQMKIIRDAPTPLDADLSFFSSIRIAEGWRLGCRHVPLHGMVIEIPDMLPKKSKVALPHNTAHKDLFQEARGVQQGISDSCAANKEISLAIDLGTTSMHWMAVASDGAKKENSQSGLSQDSAHSSVGNPLSLYSGRMLNPQMGAGSDVISRLAVARNPLGKSRLSSLVISEVEKIVDDIQRQGHTVKDICLAANPAMTAIALDKDICGLATAPYTLPFSGSSWERIASIPPVWIPPQLSSFVGGDISAGYAAIALAPKCSVKELAAAKCIEADTEFPFLLADMGTNGEFILALSPEKALSASVALGPALEGIGLSCGTEARQGAVTSFSLAPMGLQAEFYGSNQSSCLAPTKKMDFTESIDEEVCGITGTGYLSLLRRLLVSQAITKEGRFTGTGVLARYFNKEKQGSASVEYSGFSNTNNIPTVNTSAFTLPTRCREGKEAYLPLPHGLFITATDVEEFLKVKAAFSLGLTRLLDTAGIVFTELSAVYLAGSLGEYVDVEALEATGFLPQGARSRVRVSGNTSLLGAALLARDDKLKEELKSWATKVSSLDLAQDKLFLEEFSNHMVFSWKI